MDRGCKKQTVISLLTVFVCVLAAVLTFAFMPTVKKASAEESQTVTLSEVADFEISNGVLSGLSEQGKDKIAQASLYAVVVPDTATEITGGAFAGLSGLTSYTAPFIGAKSTLDETEIAAGKGLLGYVFGENAFLNANLTTQTYAITEIIKGPTETKVEGIYSYAQTPKSTSRKNYYIPGNLTQVTVTGTKLFDGAFSGCNGITDVTMDSVTEVSNFAFYGCSALENVSHASATKIGRRAFQDTTALHDIDFANIDLIDIYAFFNSGLIVVDIPKADVKGLAFYGNDRLISVKLGADVKLEKAIRAGSTVEHPFNGYVLAEIIDLRTEIVDGDKSAFWGANTNTGIRVIKTKPGAESDLFAVGDYVFLTVDNATYLMGYNGNEYMLDLPDADIMSEYGVSRYAIATGAFAVSAISIDIPDCVSEIKSMAFVFASFLKITIGEPRAVTETPADITMERPNMSLMLNNGNSAYAEIYNYSSVNIVPGGPLSVTSFVYNIRSLTEAPESGIKQFGDYIFVSNISDGSTSLVAYQGEGGNISLPTEQDVGSKYSINSGVLSNNNKITGVTIPDAVTSIGQAAFMNCRNITRVEINGNSLLSIGYNAFNGCAALASISIPNSVTTISTFAFAYCNSLGTVTLPSSLENFGVETLSGDERDAGYVFQGCISLRSVNIPDSVTTIPNGCFYGCSNLKEVTFGSESRLTTINSSAFAQTGLESVVVPASVLTLGSMALDCSTLKSIYFESGSKIQTIEGGLGVQTIKYTSFNIANVDSYAVDLTMATATFDANSTAFLPRYKDGDTDEQILAFVKGLQSASLLVVPDKATYDKLCSMTGISDTVKNKLYWKTTLGFSVTDTLGNESEIEQDKLACTNGASVKYTLIKDEGRDYLWQLDESYTLPALVGSAIVDNSEWKTSSNGAASVDLVLTDDGTRLTQTGVAARIAPPTFDTMEYTGNAYALDEDKASRMTITKVTDESGKTLADGAISVGSYTVYVSPLTGYVWDDNSQTDKAYTLVITKAVVELDWKYNLGNIEHDGIYKLDYDSAKARCDLFSASYGSGAGAVNLTVENTGLSIIKDGFGAYTEATLGEGMYRITATHENYDFINDVLLVRIDPAAVDLGNELDWVASSADGTLSINDAEIYIMLDDDGGKIIHSMPRLGYAYTEIKSVKNSVVRYTGKVTTLALAVNDYYEFSISGNAQTDCGEYVTTATLRAKDNYELIVPLENDFASLGITVTVSADGKTAVVTKTWYIIEVDNELLDEQASKELGDWAEYSITGWTFGDDVTLYAPRLAHGDEAESWASNANVELTLRRGNVTVATFGRNQFDYYVNKSLPAGDYTLTATVRMLTVGSAHTHWWNDEEHVGLDDNLTVNGFTREYSFVVDKAEISFNLPFDGSTGYADYEWQYNAENRSQFFDQFALALGANDVLGLETGYRIGYWAAEEAEQYYGGYTVSYNFARMFNDSYYVSGVDDIQKYITGGNNGTFTVYFRIQAPNHYDLTEASDSRYRYFFTVTVFELINLPEIKNGGSLIYTGSRVVPDIVEGTLYEIVWDEDDDYITGGDHTVSFRLYDNVHYRWNDDVQGSVATSIFTIGQATNLWVRDPNIVDWQYETFDTQINRIRAVPKFLDNGKQVLFTIVDANGDAVENLSSFTVADDGTTDDETIIAALNGLGFGAYTLNVYVEPTANYLALRASVDFRIDKVNNSWASGEGDLVLPSWIVGKYDPSVNTITVNPVHGVANIRITDIDGNEYYNSVTGVNKLNDAPVGKYLLIAWVDETADYAALAERTFTFEIMETIGLPWWGTLLIVIGSLIVVAAVIFILWKKGVFQILTGKLVIAIRTKATVDATIAAVRANKKAEEAKIAVAEAKRKEAAAERRAKAAEERNKPVEERAAALEAKAAQAAARAEKMRARAEALQAKAERMKEQADGVNVTASDAASTTEQPQADVEPDIAPASENAETPVAETVAETPVTEQSAEEAQATEANVEAAATEEKSAAKQSNKRPAKKSGAKNKK